MATIVISPRIGDSKPKNIGDHKKLTANCAKKNFTAIFTVFFSEPFFKIK